MYNVGVNFYVERKFQQAMMAWNTALRMDPNYGPAASAIATLNNQIKAGQAQPVSGQ